MSEEQEQIGDALDIRGMPEQERRYTAVQKYLPARMRGYKE